LDTKFSIKHQASRKNIMLKKIEISDELFITFRDFVSAKMGLFFQDKKRQDLLRGVQHAADTFGYKDIETCMTQLLKVDWTERQIQTLASYLTVGETHFYRHREHLNYFVEKILRTSIFSKDRSLKIWSAGCCTGDEAYTLAILLHENVPFISKYDISILATDINPVFLNKAKGAVFTRNSFRETPEYIQKKYFKHIARGQYELIPKIKKMVKFKYLNLVSNTYPLQGNNTDSIDIIFCRNVFIYFKSETVARICERFKHALNKDGYFFVSPVETFMVPRNLFKKNKLKTALVFQNSPLENKREKTVSSTQKTHVTTINKIKKPQLKNDFVPKRSVIDNINSLTSTLNSVNLKLGSIKQLNGSKNKKTAPKTTPKTTPKVAPKTTPKVAPKTTPKVAPKVAPKIAPKVAQKIEPKVAPKVAPKIAQKTTQKDILDIEKKTLSTAKAHYNKGNYNESVKILNELVKETHSSEIKNTAYIELSRLYSNLGDTNNSLECCKKAIDLDKMNPSGYFLYASLLMESDQIDESIDYFKKALYFDNSYVIAHFTLGNIYLSFNKKTEADMYFNNAEQLLSKIGPSEVIKDSEGLTAKNMMNIISACMGK